MLFHPRTLKRLSTHSGRLERWLGVQKIEYLSNAMRHGGGKNVAWYGPPVNLCDVPGSVWIGGDGDFTGDLGRGFFASAADSMACHLKRVFGPGHSAVPQFGAGFTSMGDLLERMRGGHQQLLNGSITKTLLTTAANFSASSAWMAGAVPVAGAIGSAAAGGRAPTKATTGACWFDNPSSGTLHLVGADMALVFTPVTDRSLMIYDRIFDVAKTMNSTTAEAVTGVPTRYQSTTALDADYAGGNFLFIEPITTLAATAHNWTVCTYTDQAGNATQTLPSVTGNSASNAGRMDMPDFSWFCPLASGDSGIAALSQMQCSALVATGTLDFVIGHPIGVMAFPQVNSVIPFDWLTNREQAPRVFDDACLAFIAFPAQLQTETFTGTIQLVAAAA